jgi:hypothetical protein
MSFKFLPNCIEIVALPNLSITYNSRPNIFLLKKHNTVVSRVKYTVKTQNG